MSHGTHHDHDDLGGGRVRLTQYLKPVRYRNAHGVLRPITNQLGNSGDPALSVGADELVQFRVRDRLSGNAPVVHFGKGQTHVKFTPLGTANVAGALVKGAQGYRYNGAWTGADLELVIAGHRLQKNIYLKPGHPTQFQFRIDDHAGLNADTLETPDFRILNPVLERGGESVPLTWAKSTQGGKLVLTATLPPGDWAGWVLDPTLSLQPDATDGVDTLVSSGAATTNYGSNPSLFVGNDNGSTSTWHTLLKYNLDGLPSGATAISASLSLFADADYSDNARTFRVYRQLRAWVEAQATWNIFSTANNWQTAGGFGANDCEQTDIGSRSFTATETLNEFKNFTLTPTTKTALDNGNGWLIKADTETDDGYRFASSDYATAASRPKLVVEYTVPRGRLRRGRR